MSAKLRRCHNVEDVRRLALRRLPLVARAFLEGGADDEVTLRRNVAAFDDYDLNPRYLVDVSEVDLSTRVLGQEVSLPVIIAPVGGTGMFNPQAEIAVARAAAEAGTIHGLSTYSTRTIEDVGEATGGPKMFQLYVFKDLGLSWDLVDRARDAGFDALCLTVDVPILGNRERDVQSGLAATARMGPKSILSVAAHPRWLLNTATGRGSVPGNFLRYVSDGALSSAAKKASLGSLWEQLSPSVTWSDAAEMVKRWNGPFAVKGVLSVGDARRAEDIGASAVVVSNHGGRQMEGVRASIDALPGIAEALDERLEILLDSGVRRGSHVLKALALGAKSVMIGRPHIYGVAAGGQGGVAKVLSIFRSELARDCALVGVKSVADIGPELVTHRGRR